MDTDKERIPLLSVEDAQKAAREAGVSEQFAGLSVFRVLLRHPEVAKQLAATLQTLLFTGNRLDARLRELAIMRIGWRTGSTYEWTQHWRVARGLNIPEQDIVAVREWRTAPHLSDADRAILQATDETLDHGRIFEATWNKCCQHLRSVEERVELVIAIGNWTMFSQLLRSLNIPLEEGVVPWPPDGRVPPKDNRFAREAAQ